MTRCFQLQIDYRFADYPCKEGEAFSLELNYAAHMGFVKIAGHNLHMIFLKPQDMPGLVGFRFFCRFLTRLNVQNPLIPKALKGCKPNIK